MNLHKKLSCDIFCAVVDNYGDIGVSWRLARQLANEYNVAVRLWVDDLVSFRKLCAEIEIASAVQQHRGVEIRHWQLPFVDVLPAQIVIEAFACNLPETYVLAMAAQEPKPVWLNLEYLSAEDWVAGCHGLPSPHSRLPLTKYFFFPGFTPQTGGLLLERNLLARRDKFLANMELQDTYWQALGVPVSLADEIKVSLFSYENPPVQNLLSAMVSGPHSVLCLVPEGRVLPQVAAFFGRAALVAGDELQQGCLRLHVLPFVEQDEYDKLLWACDINFVRGEDSCVRAQWAGKPFVWQIYPQHDGVHLQKMRALLSLYCEGFETDAAETLHVLWERWNAAEADGQSAGMTAVWKELLLQHNILRQHADVWVNKLSSNNLALNLLDFSCKVGRIAPFEI